MAIRVKLYRKVTESDPYSAVVPVSYNDQGRLETIMFPSETHLEVDYAARVDTQPEYQGFADAGTLTSDPDWLLFKFTYDASSRVIRREIAYDSWDNHLTAVYT